jgi:hypothetical protein
MGDINSESLDSLVGPESKGSDEIIPDFLVVPVEIGLRSVEKVKVELTISYRFPGGTTEKTVPVGRRLRFVLAESCLSVVFRIINQNRLTVDKDVSVPGSTTLGALKSFLEPDVIVTRMVGYDIDHDLNVCLVEGIHHNIKVFQGTDLRVDITVICDVVYHISIYACFRRKATHNHHP